MKRLLWAALFLASAALFQSPVLAGPEPVFDLSSIDTSVPVQICNKSETQVQSKNGWTTVIKMTPTSKRVDSVGTIMIGGKINAELFVSGSAVPDLLIEAVCIGDHAFPDLAVETYHDGRHAILIGEPGAAALAILRGETPNSPMQQNVQVAFSPSDAGPNQLRLTVKNTGRAPLSLCWGYDGTTDDPLSDPQLTLSATQNGVAVPQNPNSLAPGKLGSAFTLAPGESRGRIIYLDDYFAFKAQGTAHINAHYTLRILNPAPKGAPAHWNIGTDAQVEVPVVVSNKG